MLRADNATGNFTKVVQRLQVRIAIDPGQELAARLRPGMSVVAEVDTSTPPASRTPAAVAPPAPASVPEPVPPVPPVPAAVPATAPAATGAVQ